MTAFFQVHYPVIVNVFNDAKKFTMSTHVKDYHSRNYKVLRIGENPGVENPKNDGDGWWGLFFIFFIIALANC